MRSSSAVFGKILVSLLVALVMPAFAGQVFTHQVVGVSDGDTLTVLSDGRPLKIRLSDIDAPERKMSFGSRSKESLSDMCYGQSATYSIQSTDVYGRAIARVSCAGVDVNREQVARGMAWVYTRYNNDKSLPAIEAKAKTDKRGLWIEDNPTPPWLFRNGSK